MCIIYSSYIQHLTNKHKERQTTEKSTVGSEAQRRWELFFFFFFFSRVQVGSYVCSTRSQITAPNRFGTAPTSDRVEVRWWVVFVIFGGGGVLAGDAAGGKPPDFGVKFF